MRKSDSKYFYPCMSNF